MIEFIQLRFYDSWFYRVSRSKVETFLPTLPVFIDSMLRAIYGPICKRANFFLGKKEFKCIKCKATLEKHFSSLFDQFDAFSFSIFNFE